MGTGAVRLVRAQRLRPGHRRPWRGPGAGGADADILSIGESRHSLEDVYLELVDEDAEARRR
jgi:DsbC/DsbD-like thiol-disulfide interchange protein